jgi:hypothetical protein
MDLTPIWEKIPPASEERWYRIGIFLFSILLRERTSSSLL